MRQPIKWHGGKHYLAPWIVSLMPPRCKTPNAPKADDPAWLHYCEPFFGGGAVLFAMDPEGIGEVVNDIDGELTNFWRVMQNPIFFSKFQRIVEATPCSQGEFERAVRHIEQLTSMWPDSRVPGGIEITKRAVWFFIRNRQSRQALGRDFATLAKTRTRRGMNELPAAWLSAIDGLPEVHARLKRVVILNDDAIKVIRQQDGPRSLFYCDPPYLHETRSTTGEYRHEMSARAHAVLLATISGPMVPPPVSLFGELAGDESVEAFIAACNYDFQGRFLLSGYPSDLYRIHAENWGWTCHEKKIDNKASGAKSKEQKTECVWTNF